jgi:hypothetical protein
MSMMMAVPDVKVDVDRVRVHCHLVLDISGSMESRWEHTVEGVLNVMKALSPNDMVYCTIFNDKVQTLCVAERVAEIAVPLLKALCKVKPTGSTALWDAILPSLEIAMKVYTLDLMASSSADKLDYHMICVLTDGEDTASRSSRSDIADVLAALHKKLPRFQSIFIGVDLSRTAKSDLQGLVNAVGDADCQYMDATSSKIAEVFTKVVVKIQETVSFLATDGQTVMVGRVGGDSASMVIDPLRGTTTTTTTSRSAVSSSSPRLALPSSSSSSSRTSSSSSRAAPAASSSRAAAPAASSSRNYGTTASSSSSSRTSSSTTSSTKTRKYYD